MICYYLLNKGSIRHFLNAHVNDTFKYCFEIIINNLLLTTRLYSLAGDDNSATCDRAISELMN